ncbi:unnamed protein product [Orchesella dallaii]|uniref:Uncharacterized protein n=1 Tax=Orchesella dallaii TaxID=48710 RepID=A0ABP1PLH5_9HEXA
MIQQGPFDKVSGPHVKNGLPNTLTEILTTPQSLCGVGALLFAAVLGAIRLTRMSATSSIQSYHEYVEPTSSSAGPKERFSLSITGKNSCWSVWKKFGGNCHVEFGIFILTPSSFLPIAKSGESTSAGAVVLKVVPPKPPRSGAASKFSVVLSVK